MNKQITIRVISPTIIGGVHAGVGEVHTIEEGEALVIISAGRALRHVAPPAPPVESAAIAPAAEHAVADKKPRRR